MSDFFFVQQSSDCLWTLSEIILEIKTQGDDYRYLLSLPATSQEEGARTVQRMFARADAVKDAVDRVRVHYGGPQGTTGTGSIVEAVLLDAQRWQTLAYQTWSEARQHLLDEIARALEV